MALRRLMTLRSDRLTELVCAVGVCLASLAAGETTQRQATLDAMKERADDPWPRGAGHVVLAIPGSREDDKAYHEPGGSFSPGFATFGVSLWVMDTKGGIVATSDTIPLEQVSQSLVWPASADPPGIKTVTPHYTATWAAGAKGGWRLEVKPSGAQNVLLVVRSVGPSGAPLRSLEWDRKRISVNDHWTITPDPAPEDAQLGPEGIRAPSAGNRKTRRWQTDNGWAYVRLSFHAGKPWRALLSSASIPPPPQLEYSKLTSTISMGLPDTVFIDCLQAQVAHLMMSLVNNETRPGEPNNYPLNWLRDGAYVVVALARAGQIDVAKQLTAPFARDDFFGGFGAEADAPGLALWAIGEVSALARNGGFDKDVWPHIERKARLIEEMLSASEPVRRPFTGPIVPAHRGRDDLELVCDPAKDGLIMGKMDWHRPVLYVNAVSYRGLLHAAVVAHRLGHLTQAGQWRSRAASLREAWNRAFDSSGFDNERNFICGLYPTWVAANPAAYRERLKAFWNGSHDYQGQMKGTPLWTYFNLATAHQWLCLGHIEPLWDELRWFLRRQASPGLYTWWEGNGEENNFGRWEKMVRGWVKPPHVTPHYWTAAEMLLLQLDMLVFLDESEAEPVLIVGGGVPKDWLSKPMRVEGAPTKVGTVDWVWQDGKMSVKLRGGRCRVKLGPAFPPATPVETRM